MDFAPFLLPPGGSGTPVVMRHVALRLAQPMRCCTAKASRAHQATTQALQRTPTVCGSDAKAPLCPVCARDSPSQSASCYATRSDASNPPAPS